MIDDIGYILLIIASKLPKALFITLVVAACTKELGWW